MIGGMSKVSRFALLAAMGLVGSVASASAADLGGNCCADLEERVAELEATTARKGNRKVKLTVSGHVNETLLFWDDGKERNIYQVTNEVARTRFRFVGDAKINADWSAGYLLELGVRGSRQNQVNQSVDDAAAGVDVRHSAWWLQNKDMGKIWLGQTSEATDGITEIQLHNASHFALQIPDQTSGFLLRRKDTIAVPTVSYANLYMGNTSQTPGEGDRFNVVKYESPTIAGFTGSASWGEDDIWAVALRYAGEHAGFKIAFGVGYEESTNSERGGAAFGGLPTLHEHVQSLGTSGSIMHLATGLFVYGAYGTREDKLRTAVLTNNGAIANGVNDTDSYWNVQAGIEQNFFGFGKSTLFGEYWNYNGGAAIDVTAASGARNCTTLGAARCLGSNVEVWGVGFNQSIDAAAMDLYVSYHHATPEVTLGTATNVVTGKANLENFQWVMMGGIIKF